MWAAVQEGLPTHGAMRKNREEEKDTKKGTTQNEQDLPQRFSEDRCHAAANPASGRVMQKAGFVYHHDAEYHKFDGTSVSCKCYALTREHYNTLYK